MKYLIFVATFLVITSNIHAIEVDDHIYISLDSFKTPSVKINIKKTRILIRHYWGGSTIRDSGLNWCDIKSNESDYSNALDELSKAGFNNWNEMYHEPNVKDGSSFTVIVYENDKLTKVVGYNKRPKNFGKVLELVNKIQKDNNCLSTLKY